jgi:hypothetical protein
MNTSANDRIPYILIIISYIPYIFSENSTHKLTPQIFCFTGDWRFSEEVTLALGVFILRNISSEVPSVQIQTELFALRDAEKYLKYQKMLKMKKK